MKKILRITRFGFGFSFNFALLGILISLFTFSVKAEEKVFRPEDKISMNFVNEDLIKVIETYAKQSKQKFIIDAGVRGKVSILLSEPVSVTEAFNHLSSALAINGFAISTQGDTMVIKSARNVQRDLHEVGYEKPALKPERMYTWIYQLKHVSAAQVNRDFRIFPSKDGEITVDMNQNQLVISDFVSNLWRIADILKGIDRPIDAKISQIGEAAKKAKQEDRPEKKAAGNFRVSGTPKSRPEPAQQALPPPPQSEDEQ